MATIHRVSNQERTTELNNRDLFLISQTQNEYDSIWKSKAIKSKDIAKYIETQFRNDNLKEELDILEEIFQNYLHSGNLKINYDSSKQSIQLLSAGTLFSEFDASQFVTSGILENAQVKDGYLILTFKTTGGKTKEVKISLSSFIDTYYAGYGLCCYDHTFKIDPNIVSINGHTHVSSDITNLKQTLDNYSLIDHTHVSSDITNLKQTLDNYSLIDHTHVSSDITNLKQTLDNYSLIDHTHVSSDITNLKQTLDNYSLIDHTHTVNDITNFPSKISYFDNDSNYLTSHLTYSEISNGIKLSEYEKISNLKSAAYTESSTYSLSNHVHTSSDITNLKQTLDNYSLIDHQHVSSDITDLANLLKNYYLSSETSSAQELKDAFSNIKIGDFLSVNALVGLSDNWQKAYSLISSATNGLTGNVGSLAYKNSILTSDVTGYKDTTYTAGNGLSINSKNEIILTAAGISYDNIKASLSNDGYCVIFRDWMSD